jgi:cardiolipin synthase (CMP-forming)
MKTNLPNLLTWSRIAAIPLIAICQVFDTGFFTWLAFVLFAMAGITDWLDGYLARAWGEESTLGRLLDPIADKLLVAAVILMLLFIRRIDALTIIPALIILLREVAVSGLREFLAGLNVSVPVSVLAKWKTAIQILSLGFLILGPHGPDAIPCAEIGAILLWIAGLLTIYTGADYFRAGLRHLK